MFSILISPFLSLQARVFYAYKLPNGLTRLSGKAAYYANTADAYRDLYRQGSGIVWPMGRKMLSWVFKAEAFAAGTVLRQIEMANLLSYHAVEDIMSTGMVRFKHFQHSLHGLIKAGLMLSKYQPYCTTGHTNRRSPVICDRLICWGNFGQKCWACRVRTTTMTCTECRSAIASVPRWCRGRATGHRTSLTLRDFLIWGSQGATISHLRGLSHSWQTKTSQYTLVSALWSSISQRCAKDALQLLLMVNSW